MKIGISIAMGDALHSPKKEEFFQVPFPFSFRKLPKLPKNLEHPWGWVISMTIVMIRMTLSVLRCGLLSDSRAGVPGSYSARTVFESAISSSPSIPSSSSSPSSFKNNLDRCGCQPLVDPLLLSACSSTIISHLPTLFSYAPPKIQHCCQTCDQKLNKGVFWIKPTCLNQLGCVRLDQEGAGEPEQHSHHDHHLM